MRENKEGFYSFFIRSLMSHNEEYLSDAKIRIDGSGGKVFQQAMVSYLRKQLKPGTVKDYKLIDFRKNNLIQLADMTVGAIARSYSDKRDNNDRWLKKLQKASRIDNIWEFQ